MKKEAVEEYAYIVFRHLICRINLSDLSLGKNPRPVEIVLYYRDFGLPVNMGAFCLDSKLYLVGGETLREGKNLDWNRRFICDWEDIFEALSSRVIVFDPSKRCVVDTAHISPMGAPKTGARVSIIDGKAYVLSGAVYTEDLPGPRFECYDPRLNSWEPLPDPPFYRKLPVFFLYPHAIGRKIYVDTQLGIFYYDVDHKRRGWIRHLPPEGFPLDFWGRSAEYDDYGVVIAYSDDGLVAYRDELLKHCQPILQCELEDVLPKPRSDDGMQKAYILQLGGGGRFCLVLAIEGADVLRWDIHVVIFRVKMLQTEDDDDFVDAVLLHHHLYHVPAPSPDLFEIVDVFAMCELSKKHGLDFSGVDRSIKKQAKLDRTVKKGSPPSQYYQYPRSAQSEQAFPHSQLKYEKGNQKGRSTNRENNTRRERDGDPFTPGSGGDGVERTNIGRREARERKRREIYSVDESSSKEMNEFMAKFDALVKQQLAQSEKEIKSKEEMHQKDQEMKESLFQQKDEFLRLQVQKIRQKQWQAEKEILEKDLGLMAPEQAEIFRKIQQDIWAKWQQEGTLPL